MCVRDLNRTRAPQVHLGGLSGQIRPVTSGHGLDLELLPPVVEAAPRPCEEKQEGHEGGDQYDRAATG